MLHRKVDIFTDPVIIAHLCDKLIGYLIGVAIKDPEPRNIRFLAESAKKRCKLILSVKILTVASGVLCNEGQFLASKTFKIACLRNYILHRT